MLFQKMSFKHLCYWIMLFYSCCCWVSSGSAEVLYDQLERSVDVPRDPRRVVAFAPSITEIIYAIGQEGRLVGTTIYSNYPAAAAGLPKIGSYIHLDLERIVALKPDLCFATKDGNPRPVIDRLTALNIPVYTVNPHGYKSVAQTVLELGKILNAPEKAALVVEEMNRRVKRVQVLVNSVTERPRVFFQIGIKPIISAGSDTFIHELIELAGGRNVADEASAYPRYSREQVIGLSPDVIVITSMDRQAAFEQVRKSWLQWRNLPAARLNRIHLVDSDIFDRPSPRLIDALEQLFGLLHPELAEELK